MKYLKSSILLFLFLFLLLGLLWHQLFYSKPTEPPSALVGQDVPAFQIPSLYQPDHLFTPEAFAGRVALLTVWATWCEACSVEMPMLMKIKEQYHIPMYSIIYKDDPDAAKKWLQEYGNPFVMSGLDTEGDVAIDLGVYGTPETFVIDQSGKIIYRHVGIIDQEVWDEVIYPLIQEHGG